MKINLVFDDWMGKDMKSVYSTIKGTHLSTGDFHSGTTFSGQILLDSEQEAELLQALDEGYMPVFWISRNTHTPNLFKEDCWVSIDYGFERSNFYIKYVTEELVMLGNPTWLSGTSISLVYKNFMSKTPILLGPAKRRWWWKFLPFGIKDVVCPYVPFK